MIPQSQVFPQQGAGVPGELFNDGPVRADSYILDSTDAANNIFGNAFTLVSEGIAEAGGTGIFLGYLADPKQHASFGTQAGGPLAPTLTLPNNVNADIVNMGAIWVTLPAAASIGDKVVFDQTTGELATIAPADSLPVGFSDGQAVVYRYAVSGAGLALILITVVPPVSS